jgi:hypothetical protein
MEPVVYSNSIIERHPLWDKAKGTLNEVSNRDKVGSNFFPSEIECLDLDTFETNYVSGQNNCTVDAVIGIQNCKNKMCFNPRLLMVELRTNYKNANNLSKSELERKVSHSKVLLGPVLPINCQKLFVFTRDQAPVARHWMDSRRKEGGEIRNFEALSVDDFNETVKSFDDMPYQPIYDPAEIEKEIVALVCNAEWTKVIKKFAFWKDKTIECQYNRPFEYQSLKAVISQLWQEFRTQHNPLDDEDNELDAEVLEEDLSVIIL